jgi:hypothetical protein
MIEIRPYDVRLLSPSFSALETTETKISILILLRLPDDVPTIDTNRILSTGLEAFSQHHILVIFTNVFQTFEAVLPHMIAHINLSFEQRTSITDKQKYI